MNTAKNWNTFSGFEWLLIDVAARMGHDKEHFSTRIEWTVANVLPLIKAAPTFDLLKAFIEPLIKTADEPAMFCGACLAVWDTINGRESTWQVGADAASSGPQLQSCFMKCKTGMGNTGVLNWDKMPDVYTDVTLVMCTGGLSITRKIVKKGIVPHIYASEAAPKAVFKTQYPAFIKAYKTVLPKAQEASDFMVQAWNSNAFEHVWTMPDGAVVRVPVIVKHQKSIPCGKHKIEYIYEELGTKKKGLAGTKALSANITHSYDAYMLRELNRRCNYNKEHMENMLRLLTRELAHRAMSGEKCPTLTYSETDYMYYLESLYVKFTQASAVAFEYMDENNVQHLSDDYLLTLEHIAKSMLAHKSFEVSNIHDEFKCLPNNVSQMKRHYNQLLWETYCSFWWFVTMETLTGHDVRFMADEIDLSIKDEILGAPYSIG